MSKTPSKTAANFEYLKMNRLDLTSIPDSDFRAEYQRREKIERDFAWSVSLIRDYAVWESENGRARKVTEWHARQIAERLCDVINISREEFASLIIADAKRPTT
jgi:hypothetical protein